MTTTAVVQLMTSRRAGGTLSAAVLSTDYVLPLDDAADFEEEFDEPRWMVIGDEMTPRQYVACENNEDVQQSVTLLSPVGGTGFAAGDPVTLWDPTADVADKRAVQHVAWVLLDNQNKSIPVTIPHNLTPFVSDGASIPLEERSPNQWHMSDVLGREAVLGAEVQQLRLRYPSGRLAGRLGGLGGQDAPELLQGATGILMTKDDDDGTFLFQLWDNYPFFDSAAGIFTLGWFQVDVPSDGTGFSIAAGDASVVGDSASGQLDLAGSQVDVAGQLTAFGGLQAYNLITYLGAPTTSSVTNVNINGANGNLREVTSSRRFKRDIETAVVDLDVLRRLRGATWRDRNEVEEDPDTEQRHIGYIAEELHDLGFTDYLTYDDEGPRAVQYDRLVVPLVEAYKDVTARLERLERRLDGRGSEQPE